MFRLAASAAALALMASAAPAQMYYGGVYGYGRTTAGTLATPYGYRSTATTGRTYVTPGGTTVQAGAARTTGATPYGYGSAGAQGVRVTTPYGATYTRGSAGGYRVGPYGAYGGRVGGFGFRR